MNNKLQIYKFLYYGNLSFEIRILKEAKNKCKLCTKIKLFKQYKEVE